MYQQLGSISLLNIFLHIFSFFKSLSSFWMSSCSFLQKLRSQWFPFLLNVWGSSSVDLVSTACMARVDKSIKRFKFSFVTFWVACSTILFAPHYTKLTNFSCTHHFRIGCGFGDHFNLLFNLFLKKFFFNFITLQITNNIIIIITIFIMGQNHFNLFIMISSLITQRNFSMFFNLEMYP